MTNRVDPDEPSLLDLRCLYLFWSVGLKGLKLFTHGHLADFNLTKILNVMFSMKHLK